MSENKVAIITGAGTGIGAAIAEELARTGVAVILVGRRPGPLEEVVARITGKGGTAISRPGDIRDYAFLENLCKETVERFGHIDLVVPNAAVHDASSIDTGDPEWWHTLIDVNVVGLLFSVRAFLPQFLKQGYGHFIVVSSLSGRVTYVGEPIYITSKHAQVAFVECLRKEITPKGVKVTIIEPGLVETPFIDNPMGQMVKKTVTPLDAIDVARVVRFVFEQPENVTIYELSMRPRAQVL